MLPISGGWSSSVLLVLAAALGLSSFAVHSLPHGSLGWWLSVAAALGLCLFVHFAPRVDDDTTQQTMHAQLKAKTVERVQEMLANGEAEAVLKKALPEVLSTLKQIKEDEKLVLGKGNTTIELLEDVSQDDAGESDQQHLVPKVLYGTQGGTSKQLAESLVERAAKQGLNLEACNVSCYEPENLCKESVALVVMPTYTEGTPPAPAEWFCRWLAEAAVDERVGVLHLQNVRFAVFGLGNSEYVDSFNAVGRALDDQLKTLGGARLIPFSAGDEDGDSSLEEQFSKWADRVVRVLTKGKAPTGGAQGNPGASLAGAAATSASSSAPVDAEAAEVAAAAPAAEVDESESEQEDEDDEDEEEEGEEAFEGSDADLDMEDIGGAAAKRSVKNTQSTKSDAPAAPGEKKKMVTPKLHANLTKQGYKIVGSHSGVKICRWTKAMLRGRGGCYKHTFYGIESHRCMEATPSLACANKCVFCWRHHTNPIGKEWKWDMDPPLEIVETAVTEHQKMVKQMRGVPGVLEERLQEGMAPRHCALSLVGEPIMYPEINALVGELHRRRISTFLVTNAQFPERIAQLSPITQLYVSVDAATEDTLKAIDRPLFKDFWQRFHDSLSALKDKAQRTVYRLTLVKGWNDEEVLNYASLVELGQPDFIEMKGVTYCGNNNSSDLTMKNVPYYDEVNKFAAAMCSALNEEYGLACAHEHSCSVLLARKKLYFRDGVWHTWINYDKFQDLVASGEKFRSEDYMAPTPSWAVYGAAEKGFNPNETRVRKIRRHIQKESDDYRPAATVPPKPSAAHA